MNEHDDAPPADVTPELFLEWRAPRLGIANPERLNNPVWTWLVSSGLNAYCATERMQGPSAMEAGPGWCFERFGQSSTTLPDGRVVLIGGEHEDHYDPDFFIYNDVVVRHPDGALDIFGYPHAVFPPTDFHSATLVGNRIIIVGSLGYPEERAAGMTPVCVLEIDSWAISTVLSRGTPPGWIHGQKATLVDEGAAILIQGGKLDRGGDEGSLVENIDDWKLHLADWRWERLTNRKWRRWEFTREDRQPNHLWQIRSALFEKEFNLPESPLLAQLHEQGLMPTLEEELGGAPDFDLFRRRFTPDVPHEALPESEEEFSVYRIKVAGLVVRYVEEGHAVQMTVEGELPSLTVEALTKDLQEKLAALERAAVKVRSL